MKRKAADILLVEDDAFEVELTLHALRKHRPHCLVDVVRDGEEAIDYVWYRGAYERRASAQPRLLLLDINLPKRSGVEVLAAVKGDACSRLASDLYESYRCGANGYVVKPLDFGKFDQVIAALCLYWLDLNSVPRLDGVHQSIPA